MRPHKGSALLPRMGWEDKYLHPDDELRYPGFADEAFKHVRSEPIEPLPTYAEFDHHWWVREFEPPMTRGE